MRSPRRASPEQLAPYLLDVPHPGFLPPDSPRLAHQPPFDWQQIFGNPHALEIEIGVGKGLFLVEQAQARPETNFLGIEIERKYVMLTAERLVRRSLPNVKLACTDARWFLRERVGAACATALHVYFPDPWWKQKHKKRKLFTREFVADCARVLTGAGRLHFASDVADYFAESTAILKATPFLQPLPEAEDEPERILTNFERKYRLEGRPIYRAVYVKV